MTPPVTATAAAPGGEARCQARADALQALFEHIAATRMQDVPMLNPRLAVAAVGFEPEVDGAAACGVLVTPWFMNLVRLPLEAPRAETPAAADRAAPPLAVGSSATRTVGAHRFEFIGAHEPGFGSFEACSLFSPMFEFEDQAAALATARAVLDVLRAPPEPPPAPPAQPGTAPLASRRALLFGRSSPSAASSAR